jgi:L-fuconolactonase
MMICDAQVHIWAANTPERPWRARHPPHREPLGKVEHLGEMAKAGVDRVVIVPPSWEGDRNDLAIDAAGSHPDRFAIMGRFDPDALGAREAIAVWRSNRVCWACASRSIPTSCASR